MRIELRKGESRTINIRLYNEDGSVRDVSNKTYTYKIHDATNNIVESGAVQVLGDGLLEIFVGYNVTQRKGLYRLTIFENSGGEIISTTSMIMEVLG